MSLAPVMGPLRSLAGYTKCQPSTIQVDSFLRLVNCIDIAVFHTFQYMERNPRTTKAIVMTLRMMMKAMWTLEWLGLPIPRRALHFAQ